MTTGLTRWNLCTQLATSLGRFFGLTRHHFTPEFRRFSKLLSEMTYYELLCALQELLEQFQEKHVLRNGKTPIPYRVLSLVRGYKRDEIREHDSDLKVIKWSYKNLRTQRLFEKEIEEELAPLELLYEEKIINEVAYYFLLTMKRGNPPKSTATSLYSTSLFQNRVRYWKPIWGQICAFEAIRNVIQAIHCLERGQDPWQPKRPRSLHNVDKNALYRAIWVATR